MKELLRKFNAVVRFNWQGDLEYRSYFLFWAVVESLPFLVMFFLWKFIYADQSIVAGYDLSQMITYYFLVFVIDRLTVTYLEWNISGRIKDGMFAQFLYRPLPHRLYYFASSVSQRAVRVVVTIPVLIAGILIFGKYLVWTSFTNLALFFLALIVAWFLNLYLAVLTGYFAFWMDRANSIFYLRWSLSYYLSGQFLPLSFFGPQVQTIINLLPFRYTFGFPIELYLGKLTTTEAVYGFVIGVGWVLALAIVDRLVYARGIKRFKAIGN